jgi:hypothetical protein
MNIEAMFQEFIRQNPNLAASMAAPEEPQEKKHQFGVPANKVNYDPIFNKVRQAPVTGVPPEPVQQPVPTDLGVEQTEDNFVPHVPKMTLVGFSSDESQLKAALEYCIAQDNQKLMTVESVMIQQLLRRMDSLNEMVMMIAEKLLSEKQQNQQESLPSELTFDVPKQKPKAKQVTPKKKVPTNRKGTTKKRNAKK